MLLSPNPTRDELQQLMELPYGEASEILIQSGRWDYSKDPDCFEYEVVATAEVWVEAEFEGDEDYEEEVDGEATVWAKDAVEAMKFARKLISSQFDWNLPHKVSRSDLEGWDLEVTLRKVPE